MKFELWPFERGREWTVKASFVLETEYGDIFVYKGFIHDGDSVVVNWKETDQRIVEKVLPAIVHDFLYWHRVKATGFTVSRLEADRIYRALCKSSTNWFRRQFANLRYWGVRKFGDTPWDSRPGPVPLPAEWQYMYGPTPTACDLRAKCDRYGIRNGRIARLQ